MFSRGFVKGSIFLVLWILCYCNGQQEVNKVDVSVYYESLCPDSLRFIQEQLLPNWPQLKDYINIHLIPFGKSKSHNFGKLFTCQHGPHECAGNKLQSCSLNLLNQQDQQVQFVGCMMSYYGNAQACLQQVGLSLDHVSECYNSNLGIKLQLDAEKLTNAVAPTFVPTIVYDNVFDQGAQDRSLTDFKNEMCSRIIKINSVQSVCSPAETIQVLQL